MSSFTFLDNKYSPTLLPDFYLARQNLFKKFDLASKNSHIFISAPIGSGKSVSTLLWLRQAKITPIWLTLNKFDDIFQTFFKQLALALIETQASNEKAKKILASPNFTASPVKNIQCLIAELHYEEKPFGLVFDGLHHISNEKILKNLPLVLNRLPSNYHIIYISQYHFQKELQTAYYNDYSFIDEKDLAFTREETQNLFLQQGKNITDNVAKKITKLTGGFAKALSVLSHSLEQKHVLPCDKNQLQNEITENYTKNTLKSTIQNPIMENNECTFFEYTFEGRQLKECFLSLYFQENIWDEWSQELRSFCLSLCVLDDFDIDIAKEISENKNAKIILEEMIYKNEFLSQENKIFQFHCLFKKFLRNKLEESRLDNKLLYKKIALHYKEKNEYYKALYYAILTEEINFIHVFLLYYFCYREKNFSKELDFLERIFRKDFTLNLYEKSPIFHLLAIRYYAVFLKKDAVMYHREKILQKLHTMGEINKEIVTHERSQNKKPFFKHAFFENIILNFVLGTIYLDCTTQLSEKMYLFNDIKTQFGEESINLVQAYNQSQNDEFSLIREKLNFTTAYTAYAHRGVLDCSIFSLDEKLFSQVDTSYGTFHWEYWFVWKYIIRGFLALEQNNLEKAYTHYQHAKKYLLEVECTETFFVFYIFEHTLHFHTKKYEEAKNMLKALEGFTQKYPVFSQNFLAYKTKFTLLHENCEEAKNYLDSLFIKRMLKKPVSLIHIFQRIITIRVLIRLENLEEAKKHICELQKAIQDTNRTLDIAEIDILSSIICWHENRKTDAMLTLKNIIFKLYPYKYTKIFADEGLAILPILKKLLKSFCEKEVDGMQDKSMKTINTENCMITYTIKPEELISYIKNIISHTNSFAKKYHSYINLKNISKPIKLSKQQEKIMNYLSQGYSNADICNEMELKITTIKSHLSAIYKKLEVNNAKSAIEKAKKLKIL